jgi:NAD(P)-dependent dehydrogenase (short-subunit alcohol dehydrogenase family)
LDHTEEDYDRFLGTSPKGKFFMAQSAAKAMKARGGGVIVQTGSMWALQAVGATPSSAYSAASAGAHQMVAIELAPRKIRVNAVASAVVKTPMYSTFLSPDQADAAPASFNPEIEDECGLARSLASRVDDSRLFATTEPLLPRDGTS